MNRRQRRGAFLLAASALGAVGVFVSVAGYVADVEAQLGPQVTALRLTRDVPAYAPVDERVVEEVGVPERWLPPTGLRNRAELAGMVAAADLPRGSVLQRGMVVSRPGLEPGQREIAILVDAETGVAGRVRPGMRVDVLATFEGSAPGERRSEVIITGARVLNVGLPRARGEDEGTGDFGEGRVVPVTFALTVSESLVLTYAESFATHVRLALVGGGDDRAIPLDQRSFRLAGSRGG